MIEITDWGNQGDGSNLVQGDSLHESFTPIRLLRFAGTGQGAVLRVPFQCAQEPVGKMRSVESGDQAGKNIHGVMRP